MATNLHLRAIAQRNAYTALATVLRDRLGEVRRERDRRHPAPASVAPSDWPTALGSTQHVRVAGEALASNDAEVARIRAGLSLAATPAEAGAGGVALADLLVLHGWLSVSYRYARARQTAAESLAGQLADLVGRADAAVRSAETHVAWAHARQQVVDGLTTTLSQAPLATVVADAEAVRTGPALQAADAHLDQLLPEELRTRAEARLAEAAAVGEAAASQREKAESVHSDRGEVSQRLDAEVEAARAAHTEAVGALEAYVARAGGRLAGAGSVLAAVSQHPALTPAQADALDPAGRPDAVDAVGKETELAQAAAEVAAARTALEDARLTALDSDPDADPEQDAAVVAARDALADPALQDRLTDARVAYDAAAQEALDRWEVEVPPSLWDALEQFVTARACVEELADAARRNALVTDVENTGSALADALDVRDGRRRGDLVVARILAERTAVERAAVATAAARSTAYLRGEGPSGRTPAEL